eukprot:5639724-Amphidinium_carterae.2
MVSSAKEVILDLAVTKATACVLFHLAKEKEPASLRAKIQAELKSLREDGLQEKELLHPLLYTRVQHALSMRKLA